MDVASSPYDTFHKGLAKPSVHEKYTDLVVQCGAEIWKVHKVVLCTQSSYFAKACDGEWKEAKEGVIDLSGDDPSVVEALVTFFYKFNYDSTFNLPSTGSTTTTLTKPASGTGTADAADGSPTATVPTPSTTYRVTLFDVDMFAAADRFMVPGLLALVREKIKKRLLTSNLDCQLAIAQCVYDAEDITPASGGGSLRQLIGPIVFASVRKVMQEAQLAAKLEATPALAVDMIRHFCANKNPWPDVKKYLCPRCDKRFVAVIPDHTTCRCLHCGFSRLYWDSYAVPLE